MLLATADADIMFSKSPLGIRVKVNRRLPHSCDADAAFVVLLLLSLHCCVSFLWSSLYNSSANASLIISLLRSFLSAPCGVIPRHSATRTRQQSEWGSARFLPLIASQPGHPTVAPNSSMFCFVILSLRMRALVSGSGGIVIGSTRTSGLSTVHMPSVNRPGTPNHTVDV